jgi:hypothetical protein
MIPVWGKLSREGDAVILEPEPNPADGIGSALALMTWAEQAARIRATLLERMGGEERWRGPWLLFGCLPGRVHPCGYLRLDERGFIEFGKVLGPKPEDQQILATVAAAVYSKDAQWGAGLYACSISYHGDRVAIDGLSGHIGSFVMGQASPFLGLYVEGSRVRWEVGREEDDSLPGLAALRSAGPGTPQHRSNGKGMGGRLPTAAQGAVTRGHARRSTAQVGSRCGARKEDGSSRGVARRRDARRGRAAHSTAVVEREGEGSCRRGAMQGQAMLRRAWQTTES